MPDKYRLPEGVRVICASNGTGKSMMNRHNFSFVDFDWPERMDDLEGYVRQVQNALKIPAVTVMLPAHTLLRLALHEMEIPYVLFYPSRDLKADYHKRLSDRGDSDYSCAQQLKFWNLHIDSCESDPTPHKVEMRQSQARLSDYFL